MSEIIGPFKTSYTTMRPVEAHAAHLRHLASTKVAIRLLHERFGINIQKSRTYGPVISAHVGQGLQFYRESLMAPMAIRPVLQYYCYLNLAVAVVIAYRPRNFTNYRRHGVQDRSRYLTRLGLQSVIVHSTSGAIPLFHSLLSGESIQNRDFRLNELCGSIPGVQYELSDLFFLTNEFLIVTEQVVQDDRTNLFHSEVRLDCIDSNDSKIRIPKSRIEKAMPDLTNSYKIKQKQENLIVYNSRRGWNTEEEASVIHKKTCMRLVNYGGHHIRSVEQNSSLVYVWHGLRRKSLLPTLSATLLLSFGLASICRYRPNLARDIERSDVNVLLETFIAEADAIVITAMRNLLYREELLILPNRI